MPGLSLDHSDRDFSCMTAHHAQHSRAARSDWILFGRECFGRIYNLYPRGRRHYHQRDGRQQRGEDPHPRHVASRLEGGDLNGRPVARAAPRAGDSRPEWHRGFFNA